MYRPRQCSCQTSRACCGYWSVTATVHEQWYQQASGEKQELEAIMGSMSDGLVLTGIDGTVLYANLGASIITGLPSEALEGRPFSALYDALCTAAVDPAECERTLA